MLTYVLKLSILFSYCITILFISVVLSLCVIFVLLSLTIVIGSRCKKFGSCSGFIKKIII